MEMTLARFRRQVAQRRGSRSRGAPRYPEQMREFAVAHARAVRAGGGSVSSAAGELGVSEVTLLSWVRASGEAGRLREVRVRPDAAWPAETTAGDSTVEVTTPSGHVVKGLSVSQAAELLRALS